MSQRTISKRLTRRRDSRIETPQITESTVQVAAVLHVIVPREAIRSVIGPGLAEVQAAVAAQGLTSAGPWFTHHLRMGPNVFDFEAVQPQQRVHILATRLTQHCREHIAPLSRAERVDIERAERSFEHHRRVVELGM
jgi:hypothetical protein